MSEVQRYCGRIFSTAELDQIRRLHDMAGESLVSRAGLWLQRRTARHCRIDLRLPATGAQFPQLIKAIEENRRRRPMTFKPPNSDDFQNAPDTVRMVAFNSASHAA